MGGMVGKKNRLTDSGFAGIYKDKALPHSQTVNVTR